MSRCTGRALRILAFSAVDLSLPQGHALHLRGILDALAERGHAVRLVTPRPVGTRPRTRFARTEIPVLRLGVLGPWSFEKWGGLVLFFAALFRRPDLLYVRHDLYTLAPGIVARCLRIPMAVEVNASIPDEAALWGRRSVRRIATFCERFTLRRGDRILVLAREQAAAIARRVRVPEDRFRTVEIGTRLPVPIDVAEVRRAETVPEDRFLVGFAGNLSPVQGVGRLLDAAALWDRDRTELWVIGTGTEESALRARADRAPARIRLFGGVDRDEADRLLAACQVLVAPYDRAAYGRISAGGALSSKILTYLAADRPILVADLPAYSWIEEIGAGERVDADRPEVLAERIDAWRDRWVEAGRPLNGWPWRAPGPGRRFVEEGRTWEAAAEKTESVLREMLPERGGP
ncbi:MAG: glycosyltransferase [Candidatus Eisenbacteria bacterium]|nr:glycosyltransferase [Candidatus Latescibacterota bacterium]MBD3301904.1 glycosyltransferase [Candidatus Eisenbacteria bacterium]